MEQTNDPDSLALQFVGHVNFLTWRGKDARSWMCMRADFELIDEPANERRYRFQFEFEHNPDKWDPTVAYTLPDGTIPSTVTSGGLKDIPWYPALAFQPKFPSTA